MSLGAEWHSKAGCEPSATLLHKQGKISQEGTGVIYNRWTNKQITGWLKQLIGQFNVHLP
jgi:hypothetical protein